MGIFPGTLSGPSLQWFDCLESFKSEGGELILSLCLSKRRRMTSANPLRDITVCANLAKKPWVLGNDPVARL